MTADPAGASADASVGGATPGGRRSVSVFRSGVFWGLLAAAIGLAVVFRVAALDLRPMHHDEANQAIRFGQLLETGSYRYDAAEHHGPTLYYLTLPSAWLRGQHDTASLDEWTLRLVPAAFGVGLIVLLLALVAGIGRTAVAIAALMMAVAPPLTYYSRFYIQESLLLFFSLGFLFMAGRYARAARRPDALWAGAFAGLALATKETAVILLPAALGACLVARRFAPAGGEDGPSAPNAPVAVGTDAHRAAGHLWLAAAVGAAIAGLFYSSFFTNPSGFLEPIRAAAIYLGRGLNPDAHREPWYYYLGLMTWVPSGTSGVADTGVVVLVIGAVGMAFRARTAPATRFWSRALLVYAATTTAVFSALPYKTPWNVLPFYGAWVVLAAIGAAEPLDRSQSRWNRWLLAVAIAVVCGTLGAQSWRANFRYPADPRNPYAYAHTSPDVVRLAGRVRALSALHRDREQMLVAVVAAPQEQWPLPWYLRRQSRVGYWTTAASADDALKQAPLVIASAEQTAAVQAAIGDRYQVEVYGLRPDVLMSVFIERSLWDRFIDSVK